MLATILPPCECTQALTPVFTMVCAFVAGLEVPHFKLVLSVLIIAGGVALASYGAVDFSIAGIVIALHGELFEAIRLIMTQMLLQDYKFNASTHLAMHLFRLVSTPMRSAQLRA